VPINIHGYGCRTDQYLLHFEDAASYTIVVACVASTVAVPFFWITPANLIDLLVFAGIGMAGAFAHLGLIKAFEYGEASLVAPFDYGQLIGAALLGYVIFAELPDLWTWVGAAIIVASGIYVARREAAYPATAAPITISLFSGEMAKPTAPASENRPIQVERSFARANNQSNILHIVLNGVAGGHG